MSIFEKINHRNILESKLINKNKICPLCHEKLMIKNGFYGKFFSCTSYPSCNYSESIKTLLILDLDGTIFDTDFLRVKRKNWDSFNINNLDKNEIKLIKGFDDVFLKQNSPFFLENCELVFITNSSAEYAKYLLKLYSDIFRIDKNNLYFNCGINRKNYLEKIRNENIDKFDRIIAFGGDEKDALLYSLVDLHYYIVNNRYGYESVEKVLEWIIFNKENKFRINYQYDIINLKSNIYYNFKSNYFDDLVIYYKRYYDKTNDRNDFPIMKGKKNLSRLTYDNFGYDKLNIIKKHAKILVNTDFNDLFADENIIFAKVPGSKEISNQFESPMKYILLELAKKNNLNNCINDLLLRKYCVETNHYNNGANRSIKKHLDSIIVTKNILGKVIYLFDDVVSTGASMTACVEKLYEAGAGHVVCFCLGRTCHGDGFYFYDIEGGKR